MSSDYTPDPNQSNQYPPGPYYPDPYAPPPSAVTGRVVPPAVALIVVAVLNFLFSAYLIVGGVVANNMSNEEFENQSRIWWTPEVQQRMQEPGALSSVRLASLLTLVGLGGIGGILSLLTVYGAIRMMLLKSYGLAVFVSVLAAIPVLSCVSCCGIGEGVGIWSLIILLNNDVKAAFR